MSIFSHQGGFFRGAELDRLLKAPLSAFSTRITAYMDDGDVDI
jgi:hypothetical protein